MECCDDYVACCSPGPCLLSGTKPGTPTPLEPLARQYGIDLNNLNPDGSDFHILASLEKEREHCPQCGGPCLRRPRHNEFGCL